MVGWSNGLKLKCRQQKYTMEHISGAQSVLNLFESAPTSASLRSAISTAVYMLESAKCGFHLLGTRKTRLAGQICPDHPTQHLRLTHNKAYSNTHQRTPQHTHLHRHGHAPTHSPTHTNTHQHTPTHANTLTNTQQHTYQRTHSSTPSPTHTATHHHTPTHAP